MNGKIKTKFAALFAVALMITVCVVPVVDNAGVDAAPVSSSNGEVFEGYDITLYKEGGDYSGLVYYGTEEPAGVVGVKETANNSGYWVDADGKLVTVDMVADYEVTKETYGLPLIQIVYGYTDAFNNISVNVKVEQGSTKLFETTFSQSNTSKSQGHFHIHMDKDAGHTDRLNLTPEQMVGDFKVTLAGTQGFATETVSKTVNAGVATTVSGIVKDAGQNPITDKKVTVSYMLDGSSSKTGSVTTDKTGKYTIAVVPGTEVKITNVAYTGGAYTFTDPVYGFGTVNSSVTKDFVANEKTGTIIIATQTSGQYVEGANISLAWYYETRTEVSGAYEYTITNSTTGIQGLTAGKAVVTQTSDKNGVLKFAYADPVDSESKLSSYALINASAPTFTSTGIFTFTIADMPETSSDKKATLSSQITTEKGLVNLTNGSGTIYAKDSVGVISITSLNGNPIAKMSVSENSFVWYYQYTKTTPGAPGAQPTVTTTLTTNVDTTNTGMNAGKLKLIDSASDSQGKIRYAYYAPYGTLKEGYSDFSSSLFVISNPTNPTSPAPAFTYTFNDLASVNTSKSMSENISAGVKTAQGGSVSFVAKENTYKISGAIEGYKYTSPVTAILDFTINNTTSYDVNVEKDGTYGFYVIKGSIINLNLADNASAPEFDKDAYEPNAFALGTVESDKVCDFKLKGSSPVPASAVYRVDLSMPDSTSAKVNFEYTVNGEKYSAMSNDASNYTSATLTVDGYIGDEVTVVASIDSSYGEFEISEFDGYVATAVQMKTYNFKAIYSDSNRDSIPGATFDFIWKFNDEITVEELTAGEDGFASVTVPARAIIDFAKDGRFVIATGSNDNTYQMGPYSYVYLGDFYEPVATATVTIYYISAYNVEDFVVGKENIAKSDEYKANVGDSVALKAPSIDNFEFVAWMVDGVVVSDKADYTLVVPAEGCDAVALYSAVHYEEPAEGLSMNVLVIGIVILILGILAVAYGIISKKQ